MIVFPAPVFDNAPCFVQRVDHLAISSEASWRATAAVLGFFTGTIKPSCWRKRWVAPLSPNNWGSPWRRCPSSAGFLRWGTWPGILGAYTYLLGQSCVEHFEENKDLRAFSKSILARMPLNPLVGVS